MLTPNIGFSKKQQGEEQYSSVGASFNLAVEASDELVKNPEALQAEMARLFEEVKVAVDQQIRNGNGKAAANGNGRENGNGGGNGTRIVSTEEKATREEWLPKPNSGDIMLNSAVLPRE